MHKGGGGRCSSLISEAPRDVEDTGDRCTAMNPVSITILTILFSLSSSSPFFYLILLLLLFNLFLSIETSRNLPEKCLGLVFHCYMCMSRIHSESKALSPRNCHFKPLSCYMFLTRVRSALLLEYRWRWESFARDDAAANVGSCGVCRWDEELGPDGTCGF